ncbi:MAG: hypothetical protein NTW19_17070, partial [Planctomycetota bacterium]|nr:hypothetical protein [Planctomycetota bacterium]
PFWFTADYDIPVGLWRDLLGPDSRRVSLAPAMEQRLSAFPGATGHNCDAAAVFGFAAAMLARGADETYLFNHMDPGAPVHLDGDHAAIIRHAGRLETAAAQRRRHIVTYPDTWPPGVATPHRLPATLYPGAHYDFRIDTGPAAAHGAEIRVGLADDPGVEAAQLRARINLQPCGALSDLIQTQPFAGVARVVRFDVPPSTQHDGYNVFELAQQDGPPQRVVWMEVMVNPQPKVRHESLQQRDEESLGRHGEGCRATPGREGED